MKGIISFVLCGIMILAGSFSVFAADTPVITVTDAYVQTTGTVFVKAAIENPVENQYITVVACKYNNDSYVVDEENSIVYIDQFQPNFNADNSFAFNFKYADWVEEGQTYIVCIGGTNVETPGSMIISMQGGEITILFGDANMDGNLRSDDVTATFSKVLDNNNKLNIEDYTDNYLYYIDVDSDGNISTSDVTMTLAKVLDNNYTMTVEKTQ